jgi:hypothetical protein
MSDMSLPSISADDRSIISPPDTTADAWRALRPDIGCGQPATTFAQRIGRARVPKALLLNLGFPEPELHVHERLTAPRICSADERSPRARAGDLAVYLGIGAAQD